MTKRLAREELGPEARWFNWVEARVLEGLTWSDIAALVEAAWPKVFKPETFSRAWMQWMYRNLGGRDARARLAAARAASPWRARIWPDERRRRRSESQREIEARKREKKNVAA